MGTFFSSMAAAPFVMVELLGRPATEFGVSFAAVTLVFIGANFVGGRLSARVGTARMVLIGAVWSACAALAGLLWYAFGGLGVVVLFATSTLISIGNGLALPNALAGALNVVPERAGTASGAAAFLQSMMGAAFAQAAGSLVSVSAAPLFWAMLVAAVAALVFATLPTILGGPAVSGRGPAPQPRQEDQPA